jgi:hypothetical protein
MLNLGQVLELVGEWKEAESFYQQAETLTRTPEQMRQVTPRRSRHWDGCSGNKVSTLMPKPGWYAPAVVMRSLVITVVSATCCQI